MKIPLTLTMPIYRVPPTRCPCVRMSFTAHSMVSGRVVNKSALLGPSGAAAFRARANLIRSAFGKQSVCKSPRSTVVRMASRISLAPWPAYTPVTAPVTRPLTKWRRKQ